MQQQPATRYRVLVLGGYGHFGATIAQRIACIDGAQVVIAGPTLANAEACAKRLGARVRCLMEA